MPGRDLDAWREFLTRHADGGVAEGVVVSVVPYGAFVELPPGVHGLLHASGEEELAALPEVGSRVAVRIEAIDMQKRRVALSAAS